MRSPFELIMLVCFGLSWPISVFKSWKTKSTTGKSLFFMLAILIGYIAGIIHKIFYFNDFVIYIYLFNFLMVSLDIALFIHHYRREKRMTLSVDEMATKL